MAFKKCSRCGKLAREGDPRCWNCKSKEFDLERVAGEPGTPSSDSSTEASAVRCPKCGSTQVAANRKGFGVGKALIGGFLTGGVGLLGGFIGSGKVLVTCLKCGKQWRAGS